MDPLSITASAIAVGQAAGAIGQALAFLYSLKNIPDDFCNVLNELTTLQAVLEQVKNALEEYDNGNSKASVPDSDLTTMRALEDELKQAVTELDALCDRLKATEKGSRKDGRSHISKRVWLREKRNIVKLRIRANTARERLTLCFGALISTQKQAKTIIHIQRLLEATAKDVTQIMMTTQAYHGSVKAVETSLAQIHEKTPGSQQAARTRTEEPSPAQTGALVPEQSVEEDSHRRRWSVQAALQRACLARCRCQCHRYGQVRTPQLLRSVFGSLFVRYNSIPVLGTRVCDSASCKAHTGSLQLSYTFPEWLLARAVYLALSWDSLTGLGSDMHLHIPRVLQNDDAENAIKRENFMWIKEAIARKDILPTDITRSGENLILVSFRLGYWPMVRFLFQQGFSTKGTCKDGWTVAKYARAHIYWEDERSIKDHSLLQQLSLCLDDDGHSGSTLVHDSLLGIAHMSLASAIAQAPSDVNRLDEFGWSPMHWAVFRNDIYSLKAMLACPESNPHVCNAEGYTLLHFAARYEQSPSTEMAQLLLDAGVDVNATIDSRPFDGISPIMDAFHNPAMVQLLLDCGAEAAVESQDDEDGSGWHTPFIQFARWGIVYYPSSDVDDWDRSLELLLCAGISLDLPGLQRYTALHYSIFYRLHALLRFLIERGANIAAVNDFGESILHLAAFYADLDMINILREAEIQGINPDAVDISGYSPMIIMEHRNWEYEYANRPPDLIPATADEALAFWELLEEIRSRNASRQSAVNNATEALSDDGRDRSEEDEELSEADEESSQEDEEPRGRFDELNDEEFFDAAETLKIS